MSLSCKAKTTKGKACRAPATAGGLCFFHGNPDKVRALGQAGGRKNRVRTIEVPAFSAEMNIKHIHQLLGQTLIDVRGNVITPRAASAVAQVSSTLIKVIQAGELEARIARLETAKDQENSIPTGDNGSTRNKDSKTTNPES